LFTLFIYITRHNFSPTRSVMSLFSSRCMLKLKFAIYHRAASRSSHASSVDVRSIIWRIIEQALFKYRVNDGWKRHSLSPCTPNIFLSIDQSDLYCRNSTVFKNFVLYSPDPPSAFTEGLGTRLGHPLKYWVHCVYCTRPKSGWSSLRWSWVLS